MTTPPTPRHPLSVRLNAVGARALTSLPRPALRAFGRRVNADGDVLDADVLASLRALAVVSGTDIIDVPVTEGRRIIDREAFLGAGRRIAVGDVADTAIGGVRVRHYRPAGAAADAALPTLVYLHGGGWTLGSLDSHDNTCRHLCARGDVAVLSVDYRLAPEHPFPAGLDDVHTVMREVLGGSVAGVDADRVAVGGDSAGGNLAAAVCLRLRDEGLNQPRLQMLFVPVTNVAGPSTPSRAEFASGFFLTSAQMDWYEANYITPADRTDPLASPLLAADLSGLAPAYVAVAGFDPLRDEGEEYARALADAGVPVTLRRHGGLVHPFVNSIGVWAGARRALDEAVGALRLALGVH